MNNPRKFYRTVVTVEVLSEEPLDPHEITLENLAYETIHGHCSGVTTIKKTEEVSAKRMAKLLMKQGSSPEFFQIDENGNNLDEDSILI